MKNMTIEEIKAMVGTEFIFVFSNRVEIPAVVAAFDPEVGFTCLATSLIDPFAKYRTILFCEGCIAWPTTFVSFFLKRLPVLL